LGEQHTDELEANDFAGSEVVEQLLRSTTTEIYTRTVTAAHVRRTVPHGTTRYAIGGVLVGLEVAIIYLGTGIIAGASTFLKSTLSYASNRPRFQRSKYVASRDWRVVFTLGIVGGAAVYRVALHGGI
jgi:hypothetical protein